MNKNTRKVLPISVGEILLHEFMEPSELSVEDVAEKSGLSTDQVQALLDGEEKLNEACASKLEKAFGFSAEAWMNVQKRYNEEVVKTPGE